MLDNLKPFPEDKIIRLIREFRDDPRDDKIDLGVGVYRDATGVTPIMRSVRAAGRRIWQSETSKAYTTLAGEPDFRNMMAALVLADSVPMDRVATLHTPGGTGAVRQALELFKMTSPNATVWLSDPSWPNHQSIINHIGLPCQTYRYFDPQLRGVDERAMMDDLDSAQPGDAVILHGCCHNPTGADPDRKQWTEIANLLLRRRATPIIDLAYQGFGEGLDADAAATRQLAATLPEALIAVSCSKNFGIYRERTGLLLALTSEAKRQGAAQAALTFLNRQSYSFPPDHGARLVATILGDGTLRTDWEAELDSIRSGMVALRRQLTDELKTRSGSDRFGFIAAHRGMFSRLGASPEQVQLMRDQHAIYMVGDSRINIAGLNPSTVPIVAKAMLDVGL